MHGAESQYLPYGLPQWVITKFILNSIRISSPHPSSGHRRASLFHIFQPSSHCCKWWQWKFKQSPLVSPTGAIAPLQGEQTSAKDYNKEQGLAKAYVLQNSVSHGDYITELGSTKEQGLAKAHSTEQDATREVKLGWKEIKQSFTRDYSGEFEDNV